MESEKNFLKHSPLPDYLCISTSNTHESTTAFIKENRKPGISQYIPEKPVAIITAPATI